MERLTDVDPGPLTTVFHISRLVARNPGCLYPRRPGSMNWARINNTFYWIDPEAQIGVVVLMQVLPFYDDAAIAILQGTEKLVYQNIRRAVPTVTVPTRTQLRRLATGADRQGRTPSPRPGPAAAPQCSIRRA